jgi:hypothetical protein
VAFAPALIGTTREALAAGVIAALHAIADAFG